MNQIERYTFRTAEKIIILTKYIHILTVNSLHLQRIYSFISVKRFYIAKFTNTLGYTGYTGYASNKRY